MLPDVELGHGAGSSLPLPVLALAAISTIVAVAVSGISIWLHLRNYRKPLLQRMVVRIMVMVPLYAVSSLISLFSLEAAFFIDVIRDVYEAFVIYCFFVLLLDYLGGERSLLILLHGRPPIPAVFPVSLWRNYIDPSDPYVFLFLKRGILQYVQVKPLLAFASLVMKATGTYNEGDFRARSGYLYVSIVYNLSICLALWCLAVFWMCVHEDLKPFRPVPKFLCVKGILFFCFWQSIVVSFLVAVGIITRLGPYTDNEHISVGLTDTLICIEMPFFAAAHMYAFSYHDFTQPAATSRRPWPMYVARMTLAYALRDAFGLKDLVEDTRATLRGEGINYRAFEPSEGGMHIGAARDRRIRAGLRYAAGGKRKYWLPDIADSHIEHDEDVSAPLFAANPEDADYDAQDMQSRRGGGLRILRDGIDVEDEDGEDYALTFGNALAGPGGADEELYEHAKKYVFGDYLYPVVDVSSEEARQAMWAEEERVVREITSGGFGVRDGFSGYGATRTGERRTRKYDDEWNGRMGSPPPPMTSGAPRTPSPPRSRKIPECPPIATSHQRDERFSPRSRHHHPRTVQTSSPSASSASTSASPASALKRALRASRPPLVEEDAVDLVVPALGGSHVSGSALGSPALIRVWDGRRPRSLSPVPTVVSADRGTNRGGEYGRGEVPGRNVLDSTAEERRELPGDEYGEAGGSPDVETGEARAPLLPHASEYGHVFGIPLTEGEEGEGRNPWA